MTETGAQRDHTRSLVSRTTSDKRPETRRAGAGRLMRAVVCALALALCGAPALRAQDVPPDERWRTVDTEHFRVVFPARLDALGRRAAVLAERAWNRLSWVFVEPPDDRVDLILTDHVDTSNGFARVSPRLQVVVYARPPVEGGGLAFYDDWLDVVIVHELAHVFHLDLSGTLGSIGRALFGRVPGTWPVFPSQAVPRWTTEGIATWFESSLTGTGRAHGTEFETMLHTAARAGRLESIDRVSGDSPIWPAGQRPYLYGSLFFEWLLEEHGPEALSDFVDAVAGQWVPYRLDSAARSAFGVGLRAEWSRWAQDVEAEARRRGDEVALRSAGLPEPELLTSGARQVGQPRVSPSGGLLAYHRADGRSDSRIVVRRLDGGSERSIRTNGGASFDWLPDDRLVVAQFETDGPWRLWSDLYLVESDGTGMRRVTEGARVDQPSALPDGRSVLAIRSEGGHTDLVRVDLDDGALAVVAEGSDSVHWGFPSASPDGRFIAVSRWTPGTTWEVVVLSADGELLLRLDPRRAVALGAAWSPDGSSVVFTSDRSGVRNVYRRAVAPSAGTMGPLRQVTDRASAVAHPSVSAAGMHAALYTAEGWEVGRWSGAIEDRDPVPPVDLGDPEVRVWVPDEALDTLAVRPYRSLATLVPTFWEPRVESGIEVGGRTVIGPFVGGTTRIADMVERHEIGLTALVGLERGRLDATGSWEWKGWGNPLTTAVVGQGWRASGPFTVGEAGADTALVETRTRRAELSVTLLKPGWRTNLSVTGTAGLVRERSELLRASDLRPHPDFGLVRPQATLRDLRLSLGFGTARPHALSLSEERGVRIGAVLRRRTHLALPDSLDGVAGADRSTDEGILEARGWVSFRGWGWADHVIALRGSAGAARGPGADDGWYAIGDASGQPESVTGFELFGGRTLTFPVRGFDRGDRRGNRAWSASVEWRFPMALVRRGAGLLPVYVEALHGAVFADAGDAWGGGADGEARGDALTAVGAELRMDTQLFFTSSLRLRLGVAAPLSGGEGGRIYFRLGQSF